MDLNFVFKLYIYLKVVENETEFKRKESNLNNFKA